MTHYGGNPGYKPHAKATAMTLFSTFCSLTFIVTITNIDPDSYQPCNDPSAAGCVYLRIFSARNLSKTDGFFASVLNGDPDLVGLAFPHMKKRRAWHGEMESWWSFHTGMRAIFSAVVAHWDDPTDQPPALCPNLPNMNMTADTMRAFCNSVEMKEGVENHLLGPGRQVFVLLTLFWCLCRVVHDLLVLEKRRQLATLTAYAALLSRVAAASMAAYWAFGSTSVFISPHKVPRRPLGIPLCFCFGTNITKC